jgi:hypothetical protein
MYTAVVLITEKISYARFSKRTKLRHDLFTGDVNTYAKEMLPWIDTFKKIKE